MRETFEYIIPALALLAVVAVSTGCTSQTLREEDLAAAAAALSITQGNNTLVADKTR